MTRTALTKAAMFLALAGASCGDARIEGNERLAVASLLAMASNQAAYWATASGTPSGGRYGTELCLINPEACLQGYNGQPFTDSYNVRNHGYQPKLHLSENWKKFAYVLVPTRPGETGRRAFCTDDTGLKCVIEDGSAPEVKDGRCPTPCTELELN